MASLFAGQPLQAPSYAATTTDVPKWLQDYTVDLFSQQRAVAGTPYQQYQLPRIADVTAPTTAAQNLITSSSGAYQPAMQNAIAGTQGLTGQVAGTTSGLTMLQQAAGMSGVGAAQPYLTNAGQTATANIGQYMNPYTQNVTDQIAKLGARNLSENLLPAVSDQFIRAGQFGSSGMGTFGGRALRDTQEAILNQQNQALQSGYTQALGASQADLARQATLGQTAGQLTQAGQQNLGTIGAQTAATAQAEAARQAQAQAQVGDLAKMQQGLTTADAAALESVGASQQAQAQRGLDVAFQDYQNQINFPQQQINNMSATLRGLPATAVPTTGTTTGSTTQFTPSPLSQIAGAFATYKGLTAAKGGLIDGYATGGAVSADDLHSSVMADYGKYFKRGGMVPGYAEEGYVDVENPADLVDGGQAFADQYAQGQLEYPTQQNAPMPVARASGTYPVVGSETINNLVNKYGGLGDDAIKQLAAINAERTKARQDYNTQIAKLENMAPQGPSQSELWFNRAAAFLDPGKTGSFGEGLQHMAGVEAAHSKALREYNQEFMKNKIMAGLKRGEFTMEDLARQEKSTVDMAQLGITSQEKLAALLEKINAGEKERLAGITAHWNDSNGEITVVDKGNNTFTTIRPADIPENVRLEILKNATSRAEGYAPEEKPAKIEQFMKENLAAYAKTRVAIRQGATTPLPSLAPTSETPPAAPSLSGNAIPLRPGAGQGAAPVSPTAAPVSPAAAPSTEPANVGYTSPFGQYVVAPPRARTTTGEQTPQQKTEFEGQAAANLDEVKLFNTRVNEASAAGSAGVAAANQLLNVLPQIPNTGTLAPYRQQLGSVFGSLGIQGDITDSAGMLSIAQAAVSSSVLGQQLLQKGVQTEGDAKRMEMAGPTLTQPKTAVEFLTRTAKATGLRQLEMSAFRDDWRRYNNTDLGMGDAWNKYINATPLTATLPNNKLIFVNEYIDQYMKAHPTGTTEQRRGAALSNWRKLGRM
jgi:hypothetical protein